MRLKESSYLIPLFESIRWSILRRIGSLPIMRAAVFAPLIAYLILFNDQVIQFLNQVSKNVGVSTASGVLSSNIYLLYYGLIFVGVASIIYSLSCPTLISRYPDSVSFAKTMRAMEVNSVILIYFDDVLEKFLDNSERDDGTRVISYPESLEELTNKIVIAIFKRYEDTRPENFGNEERVYPEMFEFYNGLGYYVAEEIARAVHSSPKVIWGFTDDYKEIARNQFVADISFAKYEVDDNSQPILRAFTASIYGCGFLMLLIPSIWTFLNISFLLLA